MSEKEQVWRGRGLLKRRTQNVMIITEDERRLDIELVITDKIKNFIPSEGRRVIFEAKRWQDNRWHCTWVKLEVQPPPSQTQTHLGETPTPAPPAEPALPPAQPEGQHQGPPATDPETPESGPPATEGGIEKLENGFYVVIDGGLQRLLMTRDQYWDSKLLFDRDLSTRIQLRHCLELSVQIHAFDTASPKNDQQFKDRVESVKTLATHLNKWINDGGTVGPPEEAR